MEENQSWTSEFQSSFKNLSGLYQFLEWDLNPALRKVSETYPVFIPLSLARKIKSQGEDGVLSRQFLPSIPELDNVSFGVGVEDPIGDYKNHKAPQLIHRYRSRVLFAPTSVCPVTCRYCFRKNELAASEELFRRDFEKTLSYLRNHPEVTEVIFTGGDPLTLSNEKLSEYLSEFADIPSIRDIRFHSRYPVILPSRLDQGFHELIETFSEKFRTITLAIHCNHVSEFDDENIMAIRNLHKLPLQLLSQSVLLKGVNDNSSALIKLMNAFIDLKIRPYYLHHPDKVKGGMHFYLELEEGKQIFNKLRSELPGWAIPHYILDSENGTGKQVVS